MVIKKNQVKKLNSEKTAGIISGEKKLKDLLAFGHFEKAAAKGLELIVLAAEGLAGFYGGRKVADLKGAAQLLFSINSAEGKSFVRELIEIESLKRKVELSSGKFSALESEKITRTAELFLNWVKKMIPDFSEGFEF